MCEPPLGKSGKLKKVEAMPKDPPAAGSRQPACRDPSWDCLRLLW